MHDDRAWRAFQTLTAGYFAAASPERVRAGDGWFAGGRLARPCPPRSRPRGRPTSPTRLSTPAGRRLYESLRFDAVDEVVPCFRGDLDEVLEAIGNAPR